MNIQHIDYKNIHKRAVEITLHKICFFCCEKYVGKAILKLDFLKSQAEVEKKVPLVLLNNNKSIDDKETVKEKQNHFITVI